MFLNVYSIYDSKSLIYNTPFFAVNDGTAVRMVSDAVADTNTQFSRHPRDYVLFNIGVYDDQKAQLVPLSPLKHVIDFASLVQQLQSELPFNKEHTTARLDGANGEAR